MDYVMSMEFEQQADFAMLKNLIIQAAYEAQVNIFDNVFDWNLLLANQQIHARKHNSKRIKHIG